MPEQLTLTDLWFSEEDFRTFLARLDDYRQEIARLNDEIGTLREEYRDSLPVKHVEQAYGIARKRKKLAEHPKEPLGYAEQSRLEGLIQEHLERQEAETQRAVEAVRSGSSA